MKEGMVSLYKSQKASFNRHDFWVELCRSSMARLPQVLWLLWANQAFTVKQNMRKRQVRMHIPWTRALPGWYWSHSLQSHSPLAAWWLSFSCLEGILTFEICYNVALLAVSMPSASSWDLSLLPSLKISAISSEFTLLRAYRGRIIWRKHGSGGI